MTISFNPAVSSSSSYTSASSVKAPSDSERKTEAVSKRTLSPQEDASPSVHQDEKHQDKKRKIDTDSKDAASDAAPTMRFVPTKIARKGNKVLCYRFSYLKFRVENNLPIDDYDLSRLHVVGQVRGGQLKQFKKLPLVSFNSKIYDKDRDEYMVTAVVAYEQFENIFYDECVVDLKLSEAVRSLAASTTPSENQKFTMTV